jgi:hypothetical protein
MEHSHTDVHDLVIDGTPIRYHVTNGRIAIAGVDVNKWVEVNWSGNLSVYSDPKLRNELEAELFGKVYNRVGTDH